MKLRINYDFFNAILDANEEFSFSKIIRNEKKLFAIFSSSFFLVDYSLTQRLFDSFFVTSLQDLAFLITMSIYRNTNNADSYKDIAEKRLKKLLIYLQDLYVNTNYDLLLQSKMYEKKYTIHLNEYKILELIEHKYVLVPTYNFNGEVKDTCIEQEHILGTSDYILSIGSPKKELKLVHSRA